MGEARMKAISLKIDDDVDAELDALCAAEGRDKSEIVTDAVRKYVESARLRRALEDPALTRLYAELAAEDRTLAEEGIAEYGRLLKSTDDA
jgi:predicted transcriptional regulator